VSFLLNSLSYIAVILSYGKLNQKNIVIETKKIRYIAFWSINARKGSVGLQSIRSLKINSFRSVFRKELLKVMKSARSAAGADDLYKPSAWYFDFLSF
jgi:hypothetical protein